METTTKNNLIFYSHKSDHWRTPAILYNYFIDKLKLFDICPYMSEIDYLKEDIKGKNIYCNPPYSKMKEFAKWIINYYWNNKDNAIYLLIPNTKFDTKAIQELINKTTGKYYFIKGRLNYNNQKGAPFGSVLIILNYWIPYRALGTIEKDKILSIEFDPQAFKAKYYK